MFYSNSIENLIPSTKLEENYNQQFSSKLTKYKLQPI